MENCGISGVQGMPQCPAMTPAPELLIRLRRCGTVRTEQRMRPPSPPHRRQKLRIVRRNPMKTTRYPASYKYVVLLVCSLFLAMVYVTLSTWSVCVPAFQEAFGLSSAQVMAGNATLMAGYAVGSFLEGRHAAALRLAENLPVRHGAVPGLCFPDSPDGELRGGAAAALPAGFRPGGHHHQLPGMRLVPHAAAGPRLRRAAGLHCPGGRRGQQAGQYAHAAVRLAVELLHPGHRHGDPVR